VTDRPLNVFMPMITFVPRGMGGTETFARSLVSSLLTRPQVAVRVLVSRGAAGTFQPAEEFVARKVQGGASNVARMRTLVQAASPAPQTRELLRGADVVHYPFTVPIPRPAGVPWVQTLHDVQHLDLPGMFSRAERAYRVWAYDRSARRADLVVTDSEFSRVRIVERLGLDPGLVHVAHLGVDPEAFSYFGGPREPFVLYPATAWPHKNHARLIESMRLVRVERPDLRLVLTGGRRAALGSLPDWVEHRGYVSDAELRSLYRTAACLVFPSLYEGFGLPPLEAMASGCPVAAASAGSLPEICGDAAVLFDPEEVAAIAEGILAALGRAGDLVTKGLKRAEAFNWSSCAEAYVRSYSAVSGR
jgi:glycosyltransferase involved in cell wall biosynthesis